VNESLDSPDFISTLATIIGTLVLLGNVAYGTFGRRHRLLRLAEIASTCQVIVEAGDEFAAEAKKVRADAHRRYLKLAGTPPWKPAGAADWLRILSTVLILITLTGYAFLYFTNTLTEGLAVAYVPLLIAGVALLFAALRSEVSLGKKPTSDGGDIA